MNNKNEYKEIFIFVAGMTPQIVTETIYALAGQTPPVYPDEIYIITTSTGKRYIRKTLLDKNILNKLFAEYDIPAVSISEDSFIVAGNNTITEFEDIKDSNHNEIMGDLITGFIQEKAGDPSTRLHCSIAGGRKTMSFYMGAALQLFGRPWDKLYHVLVSPEFESNPHFFYKPKSNKAIELQQSDGSKKYINTDDALVHLVELPYIRLRDKFSLIGKNFRELVAEGQKEIDSALLQPSVNINLSERSLYIGGKGINLSPVQLALYTALMMIKKDSCSKPERLYCNGCEDCYVSAHDFFKDDSLQKFAGLYGTIYENSLLKKEELFESWKKQTEPSMLLRQNISKINKLLREQLSSHDYKFVSISSIRQYGSSRYGVGMDKGRIKII